MPLAERTRWLLGRYWAEKLGVSPEAFERAGVTVGETARDDVNLFVRDEAMIVGAPSGFVSDCDGAAGQLSVLDTDDAAAVREWFETVVSPERVLGPAFYGYVDPTTFDPVDADARVLEADDESAFEALRAAMPDEGWANGGPEFPTRRDGRSVRRRRRRSGGLRHLGRPDRTRRRRDPPRPPFVGQRSRGRLVAHRPRA